VLAALGPEIHQGCLRERDERAGRRVEHAERDEQRPERPRSGGEGERAGEAAAAYEDEQPPSPRDRDDAEHRLDDDRDEARNGKEKPYLRVRQRQVVADERPRRLARTEDELVEQLDRQQRRDDAAERSASQQLPGRMRAHDRSLRGPMAESSAALRPEAGSAGRKASRDSRIDTVREGGSWGEP
jgi:hypothetical protein